MEEMGMTDNQYKGMLLEDLENWEEVLELAKKANDKEVVVKAEKQIEKINNKLKFQYKKRSLDKMLSFSFDLCIFCIIYFASFAGALTPP